MAKISSFAHSTRRRRQRIALGMTVGLVTASTLTFSSPASAAVNPSDPNARFISIVNRCPGLVERQIWFKVTGSSAQGRVWKVWQGNVTCNWRKITGKSVFAWAPANSTDQLKITISSKDGDRNFYLRGDQNFCYLIRADGSAQLITNNAPGGLSDCNPR